MASDKTKAELRERPDLRRSRSEGSFAARNPDINRRKGTQTPPVFCKPGLQPIQLASDLHKVSVGSRAVHLNPKNILRTILCALICDGIIPPGVVRMGVLARSIEIHAPGQASVIVSRDKMAISRAQGLESAAVCRPRG